MFLPPDLWVVVDTMTGVQEREMRVHWQCAPEVAIEAEHDTSLILSVNSSRMLRMVAPGAEPVLVTEGWVSRKYGVRDAAPHLSCAIRGSGTTSLAAVLCANPDSGLDVERKPDGRGSVLGLKWGERSGLLTRGHCSAAGVETDAAMAWIELDRSARPVHVTAAGLSRLSIDGEQILLPGVSAGIFCSRARSGWECDSVNHSFVVAGQ